LGLFLAAHDADVAAGLDAVHEGAVREDVELLDLFALDVDVAREAEDVSEPRFADTARDDLRGQRDLLHQPREVTGRAGGPTLPLEDVALEGHAGQGGCGRAHGRLIRHGALLSSGPRGALPPLG